MDRTTKIKELNEKIRELQNYMEDFINLYEAKKNKIGSLETEIRDIKQNINKHLDDLEELIDPK